MIIELDFNSDEALYIQLRNQIILGIATTRLKEGDALPSVRQLAETIGINMHTVNKAYTVLKQEGYVKVDRRKGAVIAIDVDKMRAMEDMMYHTYNMGIGMMLAVDPADADRTVEALQTAGEMSYVVGYVESGDKEVVLC